MVLARHLRWILLASSFIWGFGVSYGLLQAYTGGDQVHYNRYYEVIRSGTFTNALEVQRDYTGSAEPLYAAISWAGSIAGIDKVVYMSVFGGLLVATLVVLGLRYNISPAFAMLLSANFYLVVLLTGAERLKFGYILMTLGFLTSPRSRWLLHLLAPLAHFQMFAVYLPLAGYQASYLLQFQRSKHFRAITALSTAAVAGGGMVVVWLFRRPILEKIAVYALDSFNFSTLIQWGLVAAVGLIVLRDKASFLVGMALLAGAIAVLGGSRLNMVAFTFFAICTVRERKTSHPLVLGIMAYLAYKTVGFVRAIFLHGDGFALSGA